MIFYWLVGRGKNKGRGGSSKNETGEERFAKESNKFQYMFSIKLTFSCIDLTAQYLEIKFHF